MRPTREDDLKWLAISRTEGTLSAASPDGPSSKRVTLT